MATTARAAFLATTPGVTEVFSRGPVYVAEGGLDRPGTNTQRAFCDECKKSLARALLVGRHYTPQEGDLKDGEISEYIMNAVQKHLEEAHPEFVELVKSAGKK